MEIAKIQVSGVNAQTVSCEIIPAGIIGATVAFEYTDAMWAGLTKTVVFKGCCTKDILNAGASVTIPAEVVAKPGTRIQVGVYGVDAEGNIAIPTLWASLGVTKDATDPSGDESTDPSRPIWAQIQAQIGDLDKLDTEAQENLVAAINEALTKGGGTGSDSSQNGDCVQTVNGIEPDENGNVDTTAPTDEQVAASVATWLDEHPEATTTVQDGSITEEKLADDLKESLKNTAKTVKMSNVLKVGTVFEKPDGLPYCGWPFNDLQYDPDLNAIVFLINAAVKHGDNGNTHLYMGTLDLDTYAVEIKEIGNPDTLGHGFYTMGFCINSDGEYLYVDAQSQTLGKSTDKGVTWTETDISAYSTWPESITQLSNGRYLFWADGSTRGVLYSDDDCVTWTRATMSGAKYEGDFLELTDGVVMCFMRKSTQGTDNGAWNGNKIQEPIVMSISYDYGATWTAATDSTTLLEGCANIATAFYHKDDDLVEVFTSPRYPYGDTMGAIWQYIATREDALNDNFGTPKVVLYAKAQAYQDFGHVGGCLDDKGDMHLMYYDGDSDTTSGNVNYHYMKASRGQAILPVHSNGLESLFLPYSARDATRELMAVRAELMAKINEIILENGGTVEDENFYVTDALAFDFDLTDSEKYDTDAGTITDTFGNVATTTFTDGAISAAVAIPAATFAEKLTDTSQLTVELCLDIVTPTSTSNACLLQTTTYKYDYRFVFGRQVKGIYTNTSGTDADTGSTSIDQWNGTLSEATIGSTTGSGSLLYTSGLKHIMITMDTDGTYTLYANGVVLHTGTIDDFGSWNALISRGIKTGYDAIFTPLALRVYNKALTADEVTQNYNYFKALHG